MMHFANRLGVTTLLTAMLAVGPAFGADPELAKNADSAKLDQIQQSLQEIRQDVKDLRTQRDLHIQKLAALEQRLASLEQALQQKTAATPRTAFYNAAEASIGAIQVQNRSTVPSTIFVNGRPYAIPALETRRVEGVPAGSFTYEVRADGYGVIQPPVNRVVNANETFAIYINPPTVPVLVIP